MEFCIKIIHLNVKFITQSSLIKVRQFLVILWMTFHNKKHIMKAKLCRICSKFCAYSYLFCRFAHKYNLSSHL